MEVDNAGDTVAAIIQSAGGDRITDVDTGADEGIAVIGVDDTGMGSIPVESLAQVKQGIMKVFMAANTVDIDGVTPRLYCAGSATKEGREGFWLFDLAGGELRATPGTYRDGRYVLETELAGV